LIAGAQRLTRFGKANGAHESGLLFDSICGYSSLVRLDKELTMDITKAQDAIKNHIAAREWYRGRSADGIATGEDYRRVMACRAQAQEARKVLKKAGAVID
jgi:hypothetical protein